jgi:uncharacterized membrane protein
MTTATVQRTILAPVEDVFDCVAHIENFQKAMPHIVEVKFLSEAKRGIGAKFRETRLLGTREETTELEVIEYVKNKRVRLLSDQGGAMWDTVFTVGSKGTGGWTELTMVMQAKPYKFLAKMTTGFVMGMIQKHLEADMDAVKAYCEAAVKADVSIEDV